MDSSRILIISHNPFSDTQNNGKTLTSFFLDWPKERIAQLYFSNEVPSFSLCKKYYRITDLEIFQAFLKRNTAKGNIIKEKEVNKFCVHRSSLLHNPIYRLIRNIYQSRSPFAYFIRSMMWAHRRWRSIHLDNWLDDFQPDVVFFQASNCPFVYMIVEYICLHYQIPLIMAITDDYVTPHFRLNPFYWLEMFKLQKCFRRLIKRATNIIAIGDEMAKEYKQRFGGEYSIAMNSVILKQDINTNNNTLQSTDNILVYTGNLGLNRWKVLIKIGEALARINEKQNIKFCLDVYSLVRPSTSILKKFKTVGGAITFKGALNTEQMHEVIHNAFGMIHVESFDKKNVNITRLSISTKIPECMASGKKFIAIGPRQIASIRYIKDNQVGYVIDELNSQHLDNKLQIALTENINNRRLVKNALNLANQRHNSVNTRIMIKKIIQRAIHEKE